MNNIKENAVLEALTLTRISDETRNDSALQRFNEAIKNEKQMSRGPLENIVIDNLIRRQNVRVNNWSTNMSRYHDRIPVC